MKRLYTLIAVLAFGASGCVEAKTGFRHVGSDALTHFVVVEPERATDAKTYDAAVSTVCRGQSLHCVVLFWTDSALAARSLPMTDAEASAVVAKFRLHRPSASHGFGCHPFGTPAERCIADQDAAPRSRAPGNARPQRKLAGRE